MLTSSLHIHVKNTIKPFVKMYFTQSSKSSKAKTDEEKAERQPFQFTYTDPGNHWCKLCKLSLQSLNNLFIHLHSKKHMQVMSMF